MDALHDGHSATGRGGGAPAADQPEHRDHQGHLAGRGDRCDGNYEDHRSLGRDLGQHLRRVRRRGADLSGADVDRRPGRQAGRAPARLCAMNQFAPLIHSFWYLLRGAAMTVLMATCAVVPATIVGVLLALLHIFGGRLMRPAILGYLFLIRGIPLLVLLTFVYYLMPLTGIHLPPFWGVELVISLYYAAFISEEFRPGLLSLPQAQGDAALCLGITLHLTLPIPAL